MSLGMTVDGMISGMSTSSIVDQLISVEALPQTALKTRLSDTQSAAAAYRAINSSFAALLTSATNLLKPEAWTVTKAASTAASVTATAGAAAQTGALTFNVVSTAATHSLVSATTWAATTDPSGYGSSLAVYNADGTVRDTVAIGGTGSLADAVSAINGDAKLGLTAAAVQVAPNQYRLQVTSKTSGAAAAFSVGNPGDFTVSTQGSDAHLQVGTTTPYDVYSPSNSVTGLMPGVTINVTKPETNVTVSVASDPDAVAASVKSLVDSANAALAAINKYGNNTKGSSAPLAGDFTLAQLTGKVLSAVSSAVGADGSPGKVGVSLTRDGTIAFDAAKFKTALAADPALAQRLMTGTAAGPGADGLTGTADDVAAVPGVAQRLKDLTTQATDAHTGTLTLLAQGRDHLADDLTKNISAWDLRLSQRRDTLMRQFSAMEVALGQMKSQSSWLAGQLGSLSSSS